jgi:hypothetical protein
VAAKTVKILRFINGRGFLDQLKHEENNSSEQISRQLYNEVSQTVIAIN